MKMKWMALMLVAGGAAFAQTRWSVGVQIGRPAPVAVVEAYRPPCPGPGYLWIEGYYDEFGNWIEGYWDMPPYVGAYWVAPRIVTGHFYAGYWGGPRGIYNPGPRYVAPRVYERGAYSRGFERPMPDRYDRGPRGGGYGHGYRR